MPKIKPNEIHTPRLRLGPVEEAQREAVIELITHPEVGKTYMVPNFTCRADMDRVYEKYHQLSHMPERFVYGIYLGDTLVGLMNDVCVENGTIELGYLVHPRHHNQGFATEALAAAIETLFRMGYPTVRTGAFPENRPSIRVMEKNGMTRLELTEDVEYRGQVYRCVLFEKQAP